MKQIEGQMELQEYMQAGKRMGVGGGPDGIAGYRNGALWGDFPAIHTDQYWADGL